MPGILIACHSKTGNTEKMAGFIREGVESAGGRAELKKIPGIKTEELLDYEGLIIGSPTYYGCMAWEVKKMLDDSVSLHGRLEGKIAGAFASSGSLGGGGETTVLNILQALIIHGMVVQGSPSGAHYGPVSVGMPDANVKSSCVEFGKKYAGLAKKLSG